MSRVHGSGTYRKSKLVYCFTGDANRQESIAEDPEGHQASTETLVGIFEGLLVVVHRGNIGSEGTFHSSLKLAIDICLGLVDFLNDGIFATFVLGRLGRRQSIGLVRSLGTPGDIMPVAERIDVENIDVG